MDYEVNPVMPSDLPPPPSYDEVMGQYVTTVERGQTLPCLAYIDIMPRLLDPGNIKENMEPTFQKFEELIEGANVWLRDNPNLSVWKCETVERKLAPGGGPNIVVINLDSVVQHEATFGFNCFVFGLRMWLSPKKKGGNQEVQQLGVINMLPLEKEEDITVHYSRYGGRRAFGFGVGISQKKKMYTYSGLGASLANFNEKIKSNPIPGTILNMESMTLKFAEGCNQVTLQEAASLSMWYELKAQSNKRYTQILHIFYVKGNPTTPEIHMQNFLPKQLTRPDNPFQPLKFDTFSSVVQQAALWLQQQQGIQISNIETGYGDVQRIFSSVEIDIDSTDKFDFGLMSAGKLRFLRIFYITSPSSPTLSNMAMTSKLFLPVSLGGNKFESMTSTMTRIDAWMRATGLPIFEVETISLLREHLSPTSQERCDLTLKPFSAKYWVNAIRVYFPTSFTEPDPNPFPPTSAVVKSSGCNII